MSKRFLITIITLVVIIIGAGVAAFFAKGYTISPTERRVVGTGIISVTSVPEGAAVYVDGHLNTATNTTISSLPSKEYDIKIVKDGYISWEKKVNVSEGLVTQVKATLFPSLPTLYPLTYTGALNPTLSPDGQRLVFEVPLNPDSHPKQTGGIWVWTMSTQPIAFSRGAEPHQIIQSNDHLDFSKATSIQWSPDSKQVLVTIQEDGKDGDVNKRSYLLPFDQTTNISDLKDITPTVDALLTTWKQDENAQESARIAAITNESLRKIASDSAVLKWSPDETKFMAGGSKQDLTPSPTSVKKNQMQTKNIQPQLTYKVYSIESSETGVQTYKEYDLPPAEAYYWLPDSEHIIAVQDGKIGIVDFDGSNTAIVWAGSFEADSVFPWPDSSRLVIVTTFPTPTGSTPNLFGINLK